MMMADMHGMTISIGAPHTTGDTHGEIACPPHHGSHHGWNPWWTILGHSGCHADSTMGRTMGDTHCVTHGDMGCEGHVSTPGNYHGCVCNSPPPSSTNKTIVEEGGITDTPMVDPPISLRTWLHPQHSAGRIRPDEIPPAAGCNQPRAVEWGKGTAAVCVGRGEGDAGIPRSA